MSCKNVCRLCGRLVLSQAVSFTGGNLVIDLPAGSYDDGCKYCVVAAQAIPAETTIAAPVVFTVGAGTEQYPLTTRDCAQVTACGIRTRTKYALRVATSAVGGSFQMLGRPCCAPDNRLASLDGGTAPAPNVQPASSQKGVLAR